MRMFSIVCLILTCSIGFSEERVVPTAGSFGFVATIQAGTDSDGVTPGSDLSLNPMLGTGLRYHLLNALMLELRVYVSYDYVQLTSGSAQYLQYGSAAGVYYWVNVDNAFSLFVGPRLAFYDSDLFDFHQGIVHEQAAACFGLQYCFSNRFAVFGDFGLGVHFTNNIVSNSNQTYWRFKVFPPEIGFVFYL
jgi:hypothetical protein